MTRVELLLDSLESYLEIYLHAKKDNLNDLENFIEASKFEDKLFSLNNDIQLTLKDSASSSSDTISYDLIKSQRQNIYSRETNHSVRMLEKVETQNVNKLMQLINTYEIYSDKLPSVMLKKIHDEKVSIKKKYNISTEIEDLLEKNYIQYKRKFSKLQRKAKKTYRIKIKERQEELVESYNTLKRSLDSIVVKYKLIQKDRMKNATEFERINQKYEKIGDQILAHSEKKITYEEESLENINKLRSKKMNSTRELLSFVSNNQSIDGLHKEFLQIIDLSSMYLNEMLLTVHDMELQQLKLSNMFDFSLYNTSSDSLRIPDKVYNQIVPDIRKHVKLGSRIKSMCKVSGVSANECEKYLLEILQGLHIDETSS